MNTVVLSLLCATLALGVSANTKCSLEMSPSQSGSNFVSFGDANCVFNGRDIQTVEAWIKPNSEGEHFADGVVFNSGWYKVNNIEKAFVLSVKQHHQLMGYIFTRSIGSFDVTESIAASAKDMLVPSQWNHVLWLPKDGRYYVGNHTSMHGSVYGETLNGISEFAPTSTVMVGQSYSGRISSLRVWSSLETPTSINTFFKTISCASSTSSLLAFYDFSLCPSSASSSVPAIKGNSCGNFHPKEDTVAFKWVENGQIATNEEDPSTDSGSSWVNSCHISVLCSSACHMNPHLSSSSTSKSPTIPSTPVPTISISTTTKPTNCVQIILAAVLAVIVGVIIVACKVVMNKEKERIKYSTLEQQEPQEVKMENVATDTSPTQKVEPVYIPVVAN